MRNRPCTPSEHGRIAADPDRFEAECSNHRHWPGLGLVIAEHHCRSTLGREVEPGPDEEAAP